MLGKIDIFNYLLIQKVLSNELFSSDFQKKKKEYERQRIKITSTVNEKN